MPPERLIGAAAFAFSGALFVALARPMIARRVKPNGWYGARTPDTFADERVWYDVNEAAGQDLQRLGVAQLAGAALVLAVPTAWTGAAVGALAGLVSVGALWMTVRVFTRGRRARAAYAERDRGNRPA